MMQVLAGAVDDAAIRCLRSLIRAWSQSPLRREVPSAAFADYTQRTCSGVAAPVPCLARNGERGPDAVRELMHRLVLASPIHCLVLALGPHPSGMRRAALRRANRL